MPGPSEAQERCLLTPVAAPEEKFWKLLREHHCEQAHGYRDCAGRIICDRNGVTLDCPLCGGTRQMFQEGKG